MKSRDNKLLFGLLLTLLAACNDIHPPTQQSIDNFPTKNLQIICPWGAGGGTDRIARYFADQIAKELGRNCVVVNKTGGSGAVGHNAGANARPDGHTIAMITAELSTMHQLGITSKTYRDYLPLLQMNGDPAAIIVANDSPWNNIDDFLAAIRASPGTIKMSGTATGGAWDLARVGMLQAVDLTKDDTIWVPTQGSAESLQQLLGGHLDAVCCSVPEAALQIKNGSLKCIVVMSSQRTPGFPDTPTLKEANIDWTCIGWRGLAVQIGTPQQIVDQLTAVTTKIAQSDDFKSFMKTQGFGIEIREGVNFTEFLADQDTQWADVTKHYGEK
ncbi:MAG: tripartite tricarboxylate transporter substrate binding protein [Planctomycetaceae bacterium]|jgi:tripartite-type tricarboxylate transporter receptor subunit TctC|nr:tripartite tricarboxylate transporter substrate binding protein [Planctomycetaceae bacterium]